jgi:hypothetical protein
MTGISMDQLLLGLVFVGDVELVIVVGFLFLLVIRK